MHARSQACILSLWLFDVFVCWILVLILVFPVVTHYTKSVPLTHPKDKTPQIINGVQPSLPPSLPLSEYSTQTPCSLSGQAYGYTAGTDSCLCRPRYKYP